MRAVCEGEFTLPLPPARAMTFFTPEGERGWAGADWDPHYPAGRSDEEGSAAGTVFTTQSTGGDATWIVVERSEHAVLYARFVPGRIAGTVAVACSPEREDSTCVRVRYDVTSLDVEGETFVSELETGYEDFLAHWCRAILASLTDA